jgi:AraC family transcriptional regulator
MSEIAAAHEPAQGPVNTEHFLLLILDGATRLQVRLSGKPYDGHLAPGSMLLNPAEQEGNGRWSHSVTAALVRLSPQLIQLAADTSIRGDPAHVEVLPAFNFHGPLLRALITELCSELQSPTPYSGLFAESAAQTIILHLLRKYSTARFTPSRKGGQLTARQMHVIRDYIDSNLDSKITLNDLASLLFMSVPHFERLFRGSFGCAPYRHVLERRIEQAKLLLANSSATLYEVARQSGFANQSHLTRHFSKLVGCSPAQYRSILKE